MQRNCEPMRKQVEAWQRSELTDVTAKVVIYEAFVEGKLEAPKHLAAPCMTFTLSPSTRSSGHGRSGVYRMPSLRHLKSSIRFPSSRRPPNSVNSSNPVFTVVVAPWGGRSRTNGRCQEDCSFRLVSASARLSAECRPSGVVGNLQSPKRNCIVIRSAVQLGKNYKKGSPF